MSVEMKAINAPGKERGLIARMCGAQKEKESRGQPVGGFFRQLAGLLRKNAALMRRTRIKTAVTVLLPAFFLATLCVVAFAVKTSDAPSAVGRVVAL
jgi:hypothetical protein